MHILDGLDYDLIAAHPKILMGFSDVTALLNTVYDRTGLVTYHGSVLTRLEGYDGFDHTMKLLSGQALPYPMAGCRVLRDGEAEGRLLGGNLSLFHLLDIDIPEGSILFLEDINEELNQIDRMLCHMRRKGMFAKAGGLVCGAFTDMADTGEKPYGFTLEDLIREHTDDYGFPIVMDAPFGHEGRLYTFPVGANATLRAADGRASLYLV